MIQAERLAEYFTALVMMDSVSGKEGAVARYLKKELKKLGAIVTEDGAAQAAGSECGNLVARFDGTMDAPAMLLTAHMDTVEPGSGIVPLFQDGVFRTDGTTILGADDKSAIAAILEVLTVIRENNISFGPLEIVLTVCEEVGLLGAKNLDFGLVTANFGYALDASDTEGIVVRAPSANKFTFDVHGIDAHAGAQPERGINAIQVASQAISRLNLGRIDEETTANIGVIEGGMATNIVPNLVTVKGEARSHDDRKLARVTEDMVAAFEDAVAEASENAPSGIGVPRLDARVESDFTRIDIPLNHNVVKLAQQAAQKLGRTLTPKISGGGADSNVFFSRGIMTGVLGTGMKDMHTVRESVRLDKMVQCAQLVLEIIKTHAMTG